MIFLLLQDATSAEIKKAYRRLSLLLHPDKNKDENAETQFRQVINTHTSTVALDVVSCKPVVCRKTHQSHVTKPD